MSEELNPETETIEKDNENGSQPQIITQIEEIEPISLSQLYGKSLNSFSNGEWGHSEEQIHEAFAKQFGPDFKWEDITSNMEDERLQIVAEEVMDERLDAIKLKGTSLVDENINKAMADIMSFVGLNVDLSEVTLTDCRKMFMRRVDEMSGLVDAYEVLNYSRRLFDLYASGTVSPEINADVLKMQDMYREGTINRETLAWYYYNVAMVYEKYSVQKNSAQAVYKEHYRSLEFMKKALDKTDSNISLIMNIKDALSAETQYDAQSILDACHRVMDNNSDNRSLYLAHKLYAETLAESRDIGGFSSKQYSKITEHYRAALEYTTTVDDKLDILKSISKHEKVHDKDNYVATQIEISDLLSGRNRIRALNKISSLLENPKAKAVILKSAINEFMDLDDLRFEDVSMYNNLDAKLRQVAQNEPDTLKKLDEIKKRVQKLQKSHAPKGEGILMQVSSKGHDVFMN